VLNRRIEFQLLTQTKDAEGGIVEAWANAFSAMARVMNLSGNERKLTDNGGQVAMERTEFTIRYNPNLTNLHRILYNDKYYNISHINDYNEGHEYMIITSHTGLNDGK
jgi:SPP1 family predicted phage head-tail adaptor